MKYAAILGLLGLISVATISSTYKPQYVEPFVSGVKIDSQTAEAPVSDPTLNVETKTEAPKLSIKVADLIIPKTEKEQDFEIDQNTLKNIEQDVRLDNLETKVISAPMPTPQPVSIPEPKPIIKNEYGNQSGRIQCGGQDDYLYCYFLPNEDLKDSTMTLIITDPASGVSWTDKVETGKKITAYLQVPGLEKWKTYSYELLLDNKYWVLNNWKATILIQQ